MNITGKASKTAKRLVRNTVEDDKAEILTTVKDAVDNRYIYGNEQQYRLFVKHIEWSIQCPVDYSHERPIHFLVLGVYILILLRFGLAQIFCLCCR